MPSIGLVICEIGLEIKELCGKKTLLYGECNSRLLSTIKSIHVARTGEATLVLGRFHWVVIRFPVGQYWMVVKMLWIV